MKGGGYTTNYSRDLPSKNNDCDSLSLTVDLHNLQPSIKDYKENDILDVELYRGLIQVIGVYGICGYVPAAQESKLYNCLEKGKFFTAKILSITKISCRVKITPA